MSAAELDDMARWFFEEGEAQSLRQLAERALRCMRAEAMAFLDAGIALLEVDQERANKRQAEADRLSAIKRVAMPPEEMRAAPMAPARGAMQRVLDPAGVYWRGMDQLSVMCRHARARHKGEPEAFVAPFTPGQVQMGRHYQALVERHDAAGMKCVSIEAQGGGSGGQGGFIEALLQARQEIATLHCRIGDGIALQVQRGGAGSGRRAITVRRLVDAVCLQDEDLTTVLRAHGWAAKGDVRERLRAVLIDALDRMQGYLHENSY